MKPTNTNKRSRDDSDELYVESESGFLGGANIDGIDLDEGLRRFNYDAPTYAGILRSYATYTRPLLDAMQKCLADGNYAEYAINAHGIKGSSFGIGADGAGLGAEYLEHAAKAGKTDTLTAENEAFAKSIKDLLDAIENALDVHERGKTSVKEKAREPDPAVLLELLEACRLYDAGRVESAMEKLESYEYERGNDLISRLREQADSMNYGEIARGGF